MPIRRTESIPGYPIFEIDHPAATARIALHGAHLMEWTPSGQAPGLYLSPQAIFQSGKAIRGGVPVCWPWFGPHPGDPALPMHGFARTRFWELASSGEDADGARLTFTLTDDADTRKWWPHAFQLELEMNIGSGLRLALRIFNPGAAAFTITGALHTYLAIGDIRRVHLGGLDGVAYLDTVGTPQQRHQEGDVIFDREVDRGYHTSAPITLNDPALGRVLTIEGTGSHSAVVWNPWIDKSRTLTDLPDGDYERFVCVETANAREDSITVPPGAEHVLATSVSVA